MKIDLSMIMGYNWLRIHTRGDFMADPRAFLKNAAANRQNQPASKPTSTGFSIRKSSQSNIASAAEQEVAVSREPAPAPAITRPADMYADDDSLLDTKIRKVKRADLPASYYRENPDTSTYQIYNDELNEFIKTFSRKNSAKRGGAKLHPSTLIEVVLDVAYYDMGLRPDGFRSAEEVREFLRSKLKDI
jgi:hypothetical protein